MNLTEIVQTIVVLDSRPNFRWQYICKYLLSTTPKSRRIPRKWHYKQCVGLSQTQRIRLYPQPKGLGTDTTYDAIASNV